MDLGLAGLVDYMLTSITPPCESTAMMAGLLGWLRFLPLGTAAYADEGAALMALGLVAMFFGVAVGLAQREIKVLLACSSASQMGFMALVLAGLVVRARVRAPSIPPGDVLVWLERLTAGIMRLCARRRLVEERK